MENYQFIGRNLEITDAMRSYAHDKLEKLSRFSDQIGDAKVVMSYRDRGNSAGAPAKVEVQLNIPQGIVRAEERDPDAYTAIDKVVDKLERQIKRHKGRLIAKRDRASGMDGNAVDMSLPAMGSLLEGEYDEVANPEIVRVKRHVLRPMSPEDAAMEMEALGHDFYMFRNLDSEDINVIYLRDDGDYGLLEPAN